GGVRALDFADPLDQVTVVDDERARLKPAAAGPGDVGRSVGEAQSIAGLAAAGEREKLLARTWYLSSGPCLRAAGRGARFEDELPAGSRRLPAGAKTLAHQLGDLARRDGGGGETDLVARVRAMEADEQRGAVSVARRDGEQQ